MYIQTTLSRQQRVFEKNPSNQGILKLGHLDKQDSSITNFVHIHMHTWSYQLCDRLSALHPADNGQQARKATQGGV